MCFYAIVAAVSSDSIRYLPPSLPFLCRWTTEIFVHSFRNAPHCAAPNEFILIRSCAINRNFSFLPSNS